MAGTSSASITESTCTWCFLPPGVPVRHESYLWYDYFPVPLHLRSSGMASAFWTLHADRPCASPFVQGCSRSSGASRARALVRTKAPCRRHAPRPQARSGSRGPIRPLPPSKCLFTTARGAFCELEGATSVKNISWRGFRTSARPSGSDPTKPLVTGLALCSRPSGCPTQCWSGRAESRETASILLPRGPVLPVVRVRPVNVVRHSRAGPFSSSW